MELVERSNSAVLNLRVLWRIQKLYRHLNAMYLFIKCVSRLLCMFLLSNQVTLGLFICKVAYQGFYLKFKALKATGPADKKQLKHRFVRSGEES